MKTLKEISYNTRINYNIFPGWGPVDDRDFIVLNHQTQINNGDVHIDVSGDIKFPYNLPKGTVRASVIILGYIIEKKD